MKIIYILNYRWNYLHIKLKMKVIYILKYKWKLFTYLYNQWNYVLKHVYIFIVFALFCFAFLLLKVINFSSKAQPVDTFSSLQSQVL